MYIVICSNAQLTMQTSVFLEYSVGAIYLVIQNLPRNVRYKKENIILVGIIPGPKEPKGSVNSFLRPLIEELKEFWH